MNTAEQIAPKEEIWILRGDVHVTREPVVLKTLLGSCVSVCLYDRHWGVGGMNHILLPGRAKDQPPELRARYGVDAMEHLVRVFLRLGSCTRHLTAKAFGGARMFPVHLEADIGRMNAKSVMDFCARAGIEVLECDFGGQVSRTVKFHPDTGRVLVRSGQKWADYRNVQAKRKGETQEPVFGRDWRV